MFGWVGDLWAKLLMHVRTTYVRCLHLVLDFIELEADYTDFRTAYNIYTIIIQRGENIFILNDRQMH